MSNLELFECLNGEILHSKDLAEFIESKLSEFILRLLSYNYVILFSTRTSSHNYELVTGMCWEYFQTPIYMHLCHIFFVFSIRGALYIIMDDLFDCQKCTILQPNY